MQGRAFLILGIALTVSNASGSAGATVSIAQEPPVASAQGHSEALPETVALLPLPSESHEARSGTRILSAQRTWVSVPVATTTTPPAQRINTARPKQSFLAVVDQPDIEERHKVIADEVLRLLPDRCVRKLENFYVRYDKPERRGLAGKNTIILDGTLPDDEFRAVLIHEALGHVFDLGCLEGSALAGNSIFKDGNEPIFRDDASLSFYRISWVDSTHVRPEVQPEDFVSGYAISDPFEDLAESVIYYVLHNDAFVQRARTNASLATKLKWLQAFLPVQPNLIAAAGDTWNGTVPWDATKLAYTWTHATAIAGQ